MRLQLWSSLIAALFTYGAHAKVFPLTENHWDNPDFVARFMGSYGFDLYTEPNVRPEERQYLERLRGLLENDPEQALTELRRRVGPEDNAVFSYYLGQVYFRRGQYDEAVVAYRDAIAKHPAFSRAYRNLGLLHVMENRCRKAEPLLLTVAEFGRADGSVYGLLGYCALEDERAETALNLYRMAAALQPQNRDWQFGTVQALLQLERPGPARAALAGLLRDDPENAEYRVLQARLDMQLQEWFSAAAHLELLDRLRGLQANQYQLLGDIYVELEIASQAGRSYKAALAGAQQPAFTDMEKRFRALSQLEDGTAARDLLELMNATYTDALSREGQHQLRLLQVQADYQQGQLEQALDKVDQLLREAPLNPDALLLAGRCASELKQWHRARLYYQRAEPLEPARYRAHLGLAQVYIAQHKLDAALTELESAQDIKPSEQLEQKISIVRSAIIE